MIHTCNHDKISKHCDISLNVAYKNLNELIFLHVLHSGYRKTLEEWMPMETMFKKGHL